MDGLANLFTAAICQVTKGRPGSVCKSRGVRAAAAAVLSQVPSQPPAAAVVIRSATSARRRVLAVVIFCGVLFGLRPPRARRRRAAPAPRDALRQALRDARALVPQASASAEPASAAVAALAQATAPELWINSREADAAPYGRNVFVESSAAVGDLERLAGLSPRVRRRRSS